MQVNITKLQNYFKLDTSISKRSKKHNGDIYIKNSLRKCKKEDFKEKGLSDWENK